jgi:hypothetical protein
MRITAQDVRTRVSLSRLLIHIDQNPEYGEALGVENTSHFLEKAANRKKEVKENVEPDFDDTVCSHPF